MMSALHAHRQRGHGGMRGFAGRVRSEAHHPAKHFALAIEVRESWRTAQAAGFQAHCTGGAPVQ